MEDSKYHKLQVNRAAPKITMKEQKRKAKEANNQKRAKIEL